MDKNCNLTNYISKRYKTRPQPEEKHYFYAETKKLKILLSYC